MKINSLNTKFESSLKPKESLQLIIEKLIDDSYVSLSSEYKEHFGSNPGEIYWQDACQQFCEILKRKLKEQHIESQYHSVDIKTLAPRAKHHMFLEVGNYYVDGTWQQLLPQPRKNDKFLILDKNNPSEDLKNKNVPKELWFIYGGKSSANLEKAA